MRMRSHEYFERNTNWLWSDWERRGFDDGYDGRGYQPPIDDDDEASDYDDGYINGAYTALDERIPGISEATSMMHVAGKSAPEDIIRWLDLSPSDKLRWDIHGDLAGFEAALFADSGVNRYETPTVEISGSADDWTATMYVYGGSYAFDIGDIRAYGNDFIHCLGNFGCVLRQLGYHGEVTVFGANGEEYGILNFAHGKPRFRMYRLADWRNVTEWMM